MKVRYIGKENSPCTLYPGHIYECIGKEQDWYRVIDNTDEDYLYSCEDFEIVEGNLEDEQAKK